MIVLLETISLELPVNLKTRSLKSYLDFLIPKKAANRKHKCPNDNPQYDNKEDYEALFMKDIQVEHKIK
jgi:hypothetical protein